eukprot:scaffold123937_cov69-Phaeocystis_antarctica.AAC.2
MLRTAHSPRRRSRQAPSRRRASAMTVAQPPGRVERCAMVGACRARRTRRVCAHRGVHRMAMPTVVAASGEAHGAPPHSVWLHLLRAAHLSRQSPRSQRAACTLPVGGQCSSNVVGHRRGYAACSAAPWRSVRRCSRADAHDSQGARIPPVPPRW